MSTLPRRLMAFLLIASLAPLAWAQSAPVAKTEGYCDPEVARALAERYKARQDDLDQSKEELLRNIKKVTDESIADLSSCVDMSWPTMSIQYPTMDQIIRGVAQELVRRACGVARDKMADARSAFTQSYYLNTRIPGVPSYGMNSSTGGSGGVTVNGQQQTGGTPGNPTGGLYGGGGQNPPPKP